MDLKKQLCAIFKCNGSLKYSNIDRLVFAEPSIYLKMSKFFMAEGTTEKNHEDYRLLKTNSKHIWFEYSGFWRQASSLL